MTAGLHSANLLFSVDQHSMWTIFLSPPPFQMNSMHATLWHDQAGYTITVALSPHHCCSSGSLVDLPISVAICPWKNLVQMWQFLFSEMLLTGILFYTGPSHDQHSDIPPVMPQMAPSRQHKWTHRYAGVACKSWVMCTAGKGGSLHQGFFTAFLP